MQRFRCFSKRPFPRKARELILDPQEDNKTGVIGRLSFLWTALLALPLFGLSAASAEAEGNVDEARALNKRGEELIEQGRISEAIELFKKMHTECGPRRYCKAVATFYLGRCHIELGEYELALKVLDRAEGAFARLQKENERAIVVQAKARVFAERTQFRKALALFDNVAEVFSRHRNKESLFELLNSTSAVQSSMGFPDQALRCVDMSERLLPPQPAPRQLAVLDNSIGFAQLSKQEYGKAEEAFQKSFKQFEEAKNPKGMAACLSNIGFLHEARSEYPKALDNARRSLEIAKTINYRRGEAMALNNLGTVHSRTGQYGFALETYGESLGISEALQVKLSVGETLNNIGVIQIIRGEYTKSLEHLKKSYATCRAVGALTSQAWVLHNLAFVLKDQGGFKEALDCARKAVALAEKTGDRRLMGTVILRLGNLQEYKGQFEDAIKNYTEADRLQREIRDLFFRANTLTDIANMHIRKGEFATADEEFIEAAKIRRTIGSPVGGILCKHALSFIERGRYESGSAPAAQASSPSRENWLVKGRDYLSEAGKAIPSEHVREMWLLRYVEARFMLEHDPKQASERFTSLKSHAAASKAGRYEFLAAVGLGLSEEKLGNWAAAEQAFLEAVAYADNIQKTLAPTERPAFLQGEQILGLKNQAPYDGLARVREMSKRT